MKEKRPCVYILASQRNGTLYIGVTSDLIKRIAQHKDGTHECFTSDYGVCLLFWFEMHGSMEAAITREKQLKKWRRAWKDALIEKMKPEWTDLFVELV